MYASRKSLVLALYGAFILTILLTYFASYPLPAFLSKLSAVACAVYLLACCHAVGRLLLASRLRPVETHPDSFDYALSALYSWFGAGLLGTVVLLLGWAMPGALSPKLIALNATLAVLIVFDAKKNGAAFLRWPEFAPSFFQIFAICIAASGILVTFVSCFSPITYYDSLVYHLALPAIYDQTGKIFPVPTNLYSYFPANVEMLFLFIINQFPEPDYVINLFGWLGSLTLSAGISAWGYEMGGRRQAILSLFLWWTMPVVLFLSIGAYVDLPLGGFTFFSVYSFQMSRQRQWDLTWLVIAGLFSGFAVATKYTGAICPILLGLTLLLFLLRGKVSALRIGVFTGAAFLPASAWFLKNWVALRNPFFPFFYQWLGVPSGWNTSNATGYFSQLTDYGAKSNLLLELLRAPFSLSASAMKYGGGFDVLGDFGWPLLLLSAAPAFFLVRKESVVRFLSVYALGYFLFWFSTKPVFRFLVGVLPIMTLLASASLAWLSGTGGMIIRLVTAFLSVPWLLSNFFLYFFICQGLQPFSVSLGFESAVDYLHRRLVYYPAFEFVNSTPEEKVLLIGEQRTYHLKAPFLASNLFAPSPISVTANSAKNSADLKAFFQANKISRIIINEAEIERLGGMSKFGFTNHGVSRLQEFLVDFCSVEFEKQRVKVIRIYP